MWTTSLGAGYLEQGEFLIKPWGNTLFLTSLTASMTVNALATGLIVFRIFRAFRVVKDNTTSDGKSFGITGGTKSRSIIFIIIESGMALFGIQLARLVLIVTDSLLTNGNVAAAYDFTISIHEMVNVILSSVIVTLCFTDNVDLARV